MRIWMLALGLFVPGCTGHRSPNSTSELGGNSVSFGSGFASADRQLAENYLAEASKLCLRDGGQLWGISLCGPIAIVDPLTRAIATNEPPPLVARPPAFGFSNSAVDWGGRRWTTIVWQQLKAADEQGFGAGWLMMHELFHRIQPQLHLQLPEPRNDHLDTVEGRYWVQLEWRALEAALRDSGPASADALRDALAFRGKRHAAFPSAAENERAAEINEGLAEYTGIAAASASRDDRTHQALRRLQWVVEQTTFVRPYGYAAGAAYGVLLERWSGNWTRTFKSTEGLSNMLKAAAHLEPSPDIESAAARYGGVALRDAEDNLDAARQARIAALRRQFVEGPVLLLPRARSYTFAGEVTPLGDAGSIFTGFRAEVQWGTLEATRILIAPDGNSMAVPAPADPTGSTVTGDGWRLVLGPGYRIGPGERPGDLRLLPPPPFVP